MVTIDQKLSLFSKLLQRSMNEKFDEEMDKLRKEYEAKAKTNKETVKREVDEILSKARKKADTEKLEMVSKMKYGLKREYISVKEKYFTIFMKHLSEKIEKFIESDEYYKYLMHLISKLEEEKLTDNVVLHMTKRDSDKYADAIKQKLSEIGIFNCSFVTAEDKIIGGYVAEDTFNKIRIDCTIESLLEDNMSYIMQTLFKAIEAGDKDGI
jgi:V/A-type H+-transporting ATPase subunit E